jgi:E3 ubiquitin-protein ligase DOA10
MEMIAFPLFCGIVLGLTTLPLLPGATLASRWAFYQQSPNWCIIMHWLAGTTFMFNFSMFVSICRGVVRPGVMWFIRDPNDEGFHPVREILERPVFLQLRKLGTGALMYLTLIVLGVSLTTQSVYWFMNGVLPLRWPVE